MNRYLVFTILLLSSFSKSFACGYSPYGEDVRYCLFKPQYFNYNDYSAFYYNANLWGFDYEYRSNEDIVKYESNIIDWYNYIGKKVSLAAIKEYNSVLKLSDVNQDSDNEFLSYLYKNKKHDVIKYLIYAKKCEDVNSASCEDSWERNTKATNNKNQKFLKELLNAYHKETNLYLKRKYAFQCIRMAFYSGEEDTIKTIFEAQFKNSKKDYLYYWSLYFNCFVKSERNIMVDIAEIMANCPEKTYACYYYFHQMFTLEKALKSAKTPKEIADIHAYSSVQIAGKNLNSLKEIYNNQPNSRILGFLLLREINKIEDWVYTPYYTNYLPSVESSQYYFYEKSNEEITSETLRLRSEKDRLYANEVLEFINTVAVSKVENPVLWKSAQIQLLFITRKYDDCIAQINQFEKKYKNEAVFNQIQKIKAICITANQEHGKAIIKDEIKSIILKNTDDKRFLFALGRELEFNGNISDGIAIVSLTNNSTSYGYNSDDVEWKGNRLKTTENFNYFYNYFDYIDFVYGANELQIIVNKLKTDISSEFEKSIYKELIKDKNYLIDLLGTKYIRENNLNAALKTFKTLDEEYWTNNYNAWERGKYDDYFSFDQNPFYSIKHTDDFIEHKEKFIITKLSVTEHLIKYLNLAENPKTKDRDYYYFLIANCYFNMSDVGNSWMMRRYQSYSYGEEADVNESYIDENEYRNKLKAIEYYSKAYNSAKTDKFKALCLRMIDFAETNYPNDFGKLKKEFPSYYSDLSNCENLADYFKARR